MKNTSILKRFLALALAVLLTISMVPVQALAEETLPEQVEQTGAAPAAGEEEAQETPQDPVEQFPEQGTPALAPDLTQGPSYEQQAEGGDPDTEIQAPPVVIYPGLNGLAFGPGELTEDTWNDGAFQPETYDYLLSRTEGVQFVHLLLDYNTELFEAIVTWEDSSEEPAELAWPSGGECDDITLLPLLAGSTIFTITVRERANHDNYVIYTLGMDRGEDTASFIMPLAEDGQTATISFTAQDGSFFRVQTDVTVSASLSETYGYPDTVSADESVSTLDVLIRIHELLYGKSNVTSKLEVASTGWINKIFGKGMNCGFAVNGSQPGNGLVNEVAVADGDFVEFFYYQDSMCGDLYTWFADPADTKPETTPLSVITGEAGAQIPVQLRGIPFMQIGYGGEETLIDSAEVWGVDVSSGEIIPLFLGDISNGKGTIKLPAEAGTYYITVRATSNTKTPIIQPLQKLVVTPGRKLQSLSIKAGNEELPLPFNPDTSRYTVTMPGEETDLSLMVTFDDANYVVGYAYSNNQKSGMMTSGEWLTLPDFPYGMIKDFQLSVMKKDNFFERTQYDLTIVHEEPVWSGNNALSALQVEIGSGNVPIYQAEADGAAAENTTVTDNHKTYCAQLPADVTSCRLTATPADKTAQVRYSTDGSTWSEMPLPLSPLQTARVQILDAKAYHESPKGWDCKTPNEFTVYITQAEPAPELTSLALFARNLDAALAPAFQPSVYSGYAATLKSTASDLAVQLEIPEGCTAKASYNGTEASLQSGWNYLKNFPVGEITVTITVTKGELSSDYTLTVTHPELEKSTDKSLRTDGITVECGNYPDNKKVEPIYQADAQGKATDSTEVNDSCKNYYVQLPEGMTAFKYTASPMDGKAKVRYNTGDGVWQTWNAFTAASVSVPKEGAKVQFQILDEKAYAADPEDWSEANNYTIRVAAVKVPQSLTVTKAPKKTTYLAGESFDPTGMKVTVTYSDETTDIIPNEELTFTPATFTNETEVTITYQELSAKQSITILKGLEGQGTAESPFLIRTTEDAVAFSEMVAAGMQFKDQYVHLMNDVTLPEGWVPVGSVSNPSNAINSGSEKTAFYGTFEGNNHTITVPAGEKPFFGTLGGKSGTEALVRNLDIYGTQIEGNGLVAWYVVNQSYTLENITIKSGTRTLRSGLMSGYGNTPVTIRNCTVEQGVTIGYDGQQSLIGSFAADFNGTIENCASAATVKGVNFVGGIVGSKGRPCVPLR